MSRTLIYPALPLPAIPQTLPPKRHRIPQRPPIRPPQDLKPTFPLIPIPLNQNPQFLFSKATPLTFFPKLQLDRCKPSFHLRDFQSVTLFTAWGALEWGLGYSGVVVFEG